MDMKKNLINALNEKEVEKTPVVAFPSVLTTHLLQKSNTNFDEACHNAEKMAETAASVYEHTHLEAITIPLDLWFESETVGHFFKREENTLKPIISKAPFKLPEDVQLPDDFINMGQFPVIEKAASILHEKYDDKNVPLIGEITAPFTLLTDLVDLGTIIKMLNSNYFEIDDALEVLNEKLIEEINFYEDIGVDCIVINDPSSTTNIVKPELFTELIQPYLLELSSAMNVCGVLHICGDNNLNLENMLSCGYEAISISQEVDIAYAREIKEKSKSRSTICGNISIGSLLMKTPDIIKEESIECLDKKVDVLGPSCNIAYETPLDNIKAMVEARDEYFKKNNI